MSNILFRQLPYPCKLGQSVLLAALEQIEWTDSASRNRVAKRMPMLMRESLA